LSKANALVKTAQPQREDEELLERILARAEKPLSELDKLLKAYKILSYENGQGLQVQSVEFSKRAWLKEEKKAQRLLISLRDSRKEINQALLLLYSWAYTKDYRAPVTYSIWG
jgi:hypothetical protein